MSKVNNLGSQGTVAAIQLLFVDKTNLSSKCEDPEWFQDLSTNAKTKEEFMFKNCQSRIRGYLSRAEQQLAEIQLNKLEKSSIANIITDFKSNLRGNRYHGHYFDRSCEQGERICDKR